MAYSFGLTTLVNMHWYAWTYQCLDYVWEFRQLLSASLPAYCGRPGFTISQHFPTIHLREFVEAVDLSIFVNLSYRLTFLHISLLYLCSWLDEICTVTRSLNGSPWIPRCLEALVLPSHFLTFEASKFPKVQEGAGLAGRRHGCFTTFKNLSRSLTAKTRHRPCAKYSMLPVHLLHQSNLPT